MTKAITKVDELMLSIDSRRVEIEKVLPKHMTTERFVAQVRQALARNQDLQRCSPFSIVDSVMKLADLGLDPSGTLGSAYLVPFKGVCTPVPGYRGLIDLAVRSGEVLAIKAEVVFWGDEFDWVEGDKPSLYHKPWYPKTPEEEEQQGERKVRAAYAIATLPNKQKQFVVMTFRDLESVRLKAPGGKSSSTPWATHRVEMYKKCPIRRLVKQLPLSPVKARELGRALEIEEEQEVSNQEEQKQESQAQVVNLGTQRLKEQLASKPEPEDADWVATPDTVPEPPEET
jgi:recombination protein RecT